MQNFNSIHETVVKDILNAIQQGRSDAKDKMGKVGDKVFGKPSSNSIGSMSSLNSAAQGLTLTFPCMCSSSLSIETANMISKALERKDVSLLQILFSAYNLSNADDVAAFIKDFHTNLNTNKAKLDDVVQALSDIVESSGLVPRVNEYDIRKVLEDCAKNTNYTLPDDINSTSLREYTVRFNYSGFDVIKTPVLEATDSDFNNTSIQSPKDYIYGHFSQGEIKAMSIQDIDDAYMEYLRQVYQDDKDAAERAHHAAQDQIAAIKNDIEFAKYRNQIDTNRLISTDVKKANELAPTLMVVNFYSKDGSGNRFAIQQQGVVGVKSKLYAVNSQDIIDKLVEKHLDSNFLLKLVKLSTREISFVKDFLFAIDSAKIGALAKSKKGSSSKLFKVLERRSLNGKVRKLLGSNINTKPITSLVISIEEVEYMKKFSNTDLMNPNTTRGIMEQLNLMFMVIVDESNEVAHFLADTGEDVYESISFAHLERESNDAGYKKMINLISRSR